MQINGNGQGYSQITLNNRPAEDKAMMHKDGEKLGNGVKNEDSGLQIGDGNDFISFEDALKTNNGKNLNVQENNNKHQNTDETSKSVQEGALESINILA